RGAGEAGAAAGAQHGLLFAAGLITGEALIGIFMAIPIVIASAPDVIALGASLPTIVGVAALAAVAVMLHPLAQRARAAAAGPRRRPREAGGQAAADRRADRGRPSSRRQTVEQPRPRGPPHRSRGRGFASGGVSGGKTRLR